MPQGETEGAHTEPEERHQPTNPKILAAEARLEQARAQLLSAAIAYGDGLISEGQLKAVRELLRERERRYEQIVSVETKELAEAPAAKPQPAQEPRPTEEVKVPPFELRLRSERFAAEDAEAAEQALRRHLSEDKSSEPAPPQWKAAYPLETSTTGRVPSEVTKELKRKVYKLERKLVRLERDFHDGRINSSQYRAVRRHYLEQRNVAHRLRQANPKSDRWRVVLQEGKTSFLLKLNEALCVAVAFYDIETRKCLYLEGELHPGVEEAISLLSTFGSGSVDEASSPIYATETEDGLVLNLMPGRYTACLAVFSADPPPWQVHALQEVHRNFEAANKTALGRGQRKTMVFPDLRRIIKPL
jgi:hypothetical protein